MLVSQNIDSLKKVLGAAGHDTTRCMILMMLSESASDDEWPAFNEKMKLIAEENLKRLSPSDKMYNTYLSFLSASLNNSGYLASQRGNIPEALKIFEKNMNIQIALDDKDGLASSFNNLAFNYNNLGDVSKALEYFGRSLKLARETNDEKSMSRALNNMASIYNTHGDVEKALEYYTMSLNIQEKIADKFGMAASLGNIGFVHAKKNNVPLALQYFEKSLKIRQEIGDKQGQSGTLHNIGAAYTKTGDFLKARKYYDQSYAIQEEIKDANGMAFSLKNIGETYFQEGKFSKASEYASQSLEIARKIGFPKITMEVAKLLYKINRETNNNEKALSYYELYISMSDSLTNMETKKASLKSQLKYEYEKRMATDSVEHAKESEIKKVLIAKQESELNAKRNQQYALFGGLGLVMVFAGFMYNRFRLTQKQKRIIEFQKKIVEEKQKEIVDSIYYARRIQQALITNEKYIDKNLRKFTNT